MIKVTKFSATWCGPCKALAPKFEEIKQNYSENMNIIFKEFDVDKAQHFAKEYNIRSVPTVIIESVENNKQTILDRITGNAPDLIKDSIEKALKK